MARCVRRAFLCGQDAYSGRSFEHRREWVRERLRALSDVFAIDVCAYAIMSNHLHVVLHVDQQRAAKWSDAELTRRYGKLYPMAKADYELLPRDKQRALREEWRGRLCNLSWFMRALNERIARLANQEDGVSGRFWEGRFKSQALVDEQGLITCMAYVDLNPVRAGLADTLEGSDFTSIQQRLQHLARKRRQRRKTTAPSALAPLAEQEAEGQSETAVPVTLDGYVELLEWTGRGIAKGKRGKLSGPPPKFLVDHGLSPERWAAALADQRIGAVAFLGRAETIEALAHKRNKGWLRGLGLARSCAV